MIKTYEFFINDKCTKEGCSIKPSDLFYRAEQKLVDTMLTADILHLAYNKARNICIVTSDDDLMPGIMTACAMKTQIIHIHTKRGRSTPPNYLKNFGHTYIQNNF